MLDLEDFAQGPLFFPSLSYMSSTRYILCATCSKLLKTPGVPVRLSRPCLHVYLQCSCPSKRRGTGRACTSDSKLLSASALVQCIGILIYTDWGSRKAASSRPPSSDLMTACLPAGPSELDTDRLHCANTSCTCRSCPIAYTSLLLSA